MSEIVSYYEDPKEIEKKIWELLLTAVKDRSSEFRTPVFICGNDKDLDGRVVVLRKADQQNNFIQYHSDIRSSKIEKIKQNPSCAILFYGKEEKIQLRVKAECKVHFDDEITKESWEKTGHISRKCYLVTNGPGTESDKPTSGLDNKFDYGFAVDWMRKDLKIAMEEAKKNNSPLPITKIIDDYYAEVQKMGGQRWDTSSLIKRFRK